MILAAAVLASTVTFIPPSPPDRFNMWPQDRDRSAPSEMTLEDIEDGLKLPGSTEGKAAAVEALIDYAAPGMERSVEFWQRLPRSLELIKTFRETEKDPLLLRWALTRFAGPVLAMARDDVTFHPMDDAWKKGWPAIEAFKMSLAVDRDPRVAEFVERYEKRLDGPQWRLRKKESLELEKRILAKKPEFADHLKKVRSLCESIEKSQFSVRDKMAARIRKTPGLPPARLERLLAEDSETSEYRAAAVWGNMYRRVLRESLPEELTRDVVVERLVLGWPDYSFLRDEADSR